MAVTQLTTDEVVREALETLQLPPHVGLASDEGIAASLRRAASFSSPTTPQELVRRTAEVMRGLGGFDEGTPQHIARVVDDLVAYGDLLELPVEDDNGRRRNLFLGPPGYVRRAGSNRALLIGIRSEGASLLGDDLVPEIEYTGHARVFWCPQDATLDDLLEAEGLLPVAPEQWLHAPRETNFHDVVGFYTSRLEAQGLPGDVELQVIDPASKPTYYRGRWRTLKSDDAGLFVARRPQAYGADLWCFARVSAGRVTKLIDLPVDDPLAPGADEAWRLQAALDAAHGDPQRLRREPAADLAWTRLAFFSPLPSWAQRRLDVVGTRRRGARGALFAYELPSDEVEEEIAFLASRFWLSTDMTTA